MKELLTETELLLALQEIPAGSKVASRLFLTKRNKKTKQPQLLEKISENESMLAQLWSAYLDREAILTDADYQSNMARSLTLQFFKSQKDLFLQKIGDLVVLKKTELAMATRTTGGDKFIEGGLARAVVQVFVAELGGTIFELALRRRHHGEKDILQLQWKLLSKVASQLSIIMSFQGLLLEKQKLAQRGDSAEFSYALTDAKKSQKANLIFEVEDPAENRRYLLFQLNIKQE